MSMDKHYEFGYQSPKQKAIIIGVKVFVFAVMAQSLYILGWQEETLAERVTSVSVVFTCIWVYMNLQNVKTELKELFVPPFNIFAGLEFLLVGFCLGLYGTFSTIENIVRLHLGF